MLLAEIEVTIARVKQMEQYLDEVLACFCADEDDIAEALNTKNIAQYKLEKLKAYYESGLWLHDYECDERGELPANLKRGVLAQDTLYDLLSEIDRKLQ